MNNLHPFLERCPHRGVMKSKYPANERSKKEDEPHHDLVWVHNCGVQIIHISQYDSFEENTGFPNGRP